MIKFVTFEIRNVFDHGLICYIFPGPQRWYGVLHAVLPGSGHVDLECFE